MHVVKDHKIGEGGFGAVYICHDTVTGRKHALKEIHVREHEGLRCLIEIHIMVKAKHQTINRSTGISFESNNLLILQNAANYDLKTWREKNVPSESIVQKIVHQITSGLDYLHHSMGIIHGDIKPGNILCFSGNNFKLTDFSVSVDKRWQNKHKSLCTTTHRPPEVWLKQEIDEKVDIWSLGCTLHEVIFNFRLFSHQAPGMSHEERMRQHQEIFYRSMNAIYDWAFVSEQTADLKYEKENVKYFPIEKCDSYKDNSMNNLMFLMLRIKPEKRPSTKDILRHSFMKGKNRNPNQKCVSEIKDYQKYDDILQGKKKASQRLHNHVQFLITHKKYVSCWQDVARHSCIIYDQFTAKQEIKNLHLAHVTCLYTAYNLVIRSNLPAQIVEKHFQVSIPQVSRLQQKICVALDFNFY